MIGRVSSNNPKKEPTQKQDLPKKIQEKLLRQGFMMTNLYIYHWYPW
jgi:NADPH-dependent curcumin reductase CurA